MASPVSNRRPRHAPLAWLLAPAALLVAHVAAACPPGYLDKAGRCVPGPATQPRPAARSRIRTVPIHPVGPGPVEGAAASGSRHGIIFVGGKRAINSQPVPPGHAPHPEWRRRATPAPISAPKPAPSSH